MAFTVESPELEMVIETFSQTRSRADMSALEEAFASSVLHDPSSSTSALEEARISTRPASSAVISTSDDDEASTVTSPPLLVATTSPLEEA